MTTEVMAAWTAGNVETGATRSKVVADGLYRTQIVQYAGASGDFNPLHTDEVFTTTVAGYPSVFAHGMLSMGLTGSLLTDALGDGTLRSFGVRFRSQVWPGDTLTATATVTAVTRETDETLVCLDVQTVNQKGEVVVSGTATAALPN
ncbi:MAG: MaoC/PaaZ C-terminal domain-containing protein [Streptosporangiaceae bacterium]